MSLLRTAYLLEKYGMRLNVEQLAVELGITPGAVRNQISARTFPIPTYQDQGRRWADAQHVAAYFERRAQEAAEQREGSPA